MKIIKQNRNEIIDDVRVICEVKRLLLLDQT